MDEGRKLTEKDGVTMGLIEGSMLLFGEEDDRLGKIVEGNSLLGDGEEEGDSLLGDGEEEGDSRLGEGEEEGDSLLGEGEEEGDSVPREGDSLIIVVEDDELG